MIFLFSFCFHQLTYQKTNFFILLIILRFFSYSIALTKRTTQIWFQNARARIKKKPCATTSSPPTYTALANNNLNIVDTLHLSAGNENRFDKSFRSSFVWQFQNNIWIRKSINNIYNGHHHTHLLRHHWFTMVKIAMKNIRLDTSKLTSENVNHLCRMPLERRITFVVLFLVVSYLTVNIFCCPCINLDVLTR